VGLRRISPYPAMPKMAAPSRCGQQRAVMCRQPIRSNPRSLFRQTTIRLIRTLPRSLQPQVGTPSQKPKPLLREASRRHLGSCSCKPAMCQNNLNLGARRSFNGQCLFPAHRTCARSKRMR
jgi:hypothetical protein